MRFMWIVLLGIGLAAPGVASAQVEGTSVDSLALARQYTQWLYTGEADSLVAHSTEDAREGFATAEGYTRYSETIAERAGFEAEVVEETWKLRGGACQYWRTARFTDVDESMLVRWVLDDAGRIAGLGLGPALQPPPVEAETCARTANE